jgi:hypothetical protein
MRCAEAGTPFRKKGKKSEGFWMAYAHKEKGGTVPLCAIVNNHHA